MVWGFGKNPAAGDATDTGDGAVPTDAARDGKDASRPLSALAERLSELEQSLTVVASEIGVSGLPQYKHLDPAKVYAEAVRQARDATSQAQTELNQRAQQASAAAAAVGVRLEKELHAVVGRIDGMEMRLQGLMQQLDTLRRRSEEGQPLASSLAALQRRLEAIEHRLAAPDDAPQRPLDALEARLERRIDRVAAAASAAETNTFTEPATIGGADAQGLQQLVATELAVLLARKAERNEPTPLLANSAASEINPLVMTAAEHAIVRLTRRIEKLEKRRERSEARPSPTPRLGSRSGRSLMGRLFEG